MAQAEIEIARRDAALGGNPKPYFDEAARLNPLASIEAMQAASPFFARLFRRFTWLGEGSRSLRKRSWRSLRRAALYFVVFAAFSFFLHDGADMVNGQLAGDDLALEIVSSLWYAGVAILGISLLFNLLLDFSILSLQIGRDGEWELLRLSPLSRRGIVVTVFAYWRLCYWERALSAFHTRLIALGVIAATSSGFLWLFDYYLGIIFDDHPAQAVVLLLTFVALAVTLLFEVRWRLNGLSAVATALALLVGKDYALPARVGALLASVLGQAAVLVASATVSGGIVNLLRDWQYEIRLFSERDGLGIEPVLLQLLFTCVLFGVGLYVYFRLMRLFALRMGYWVLLREDGTA